MQRRRPPPIPSPLRQMRRAYSSSNSNTSPAPTLDRRSSRASSGSSVSSTNSAASTGSYWSAWSSSSARRQSTIDSVTVPMSRMSLSGGRAPQVRQVTTVDPCCTPSKAPLMFGRPSYSNGMLSVNIAPPGLSAVDKIEIPVKFCDYDKQDRLIVQCLRERNFSNCRLSQVSISFNDGDDTVALQRRPLLTLDAGVTWRTLSEMRVIDYREKDTGMQLNGEGLPYGQAKVRLLDLDASRHNLWLDWSLLNVRGNDELLNSVDKISPEMRLWLVSNWIKVGRLIVENVQLNSDGRAISGDLSLRPFGPYKK